MSQPAQSTRLLTFEDVCRFDPDAQPGDLVAGVWASAVPRTYREGGIVATLGIELVLIGARIILERGNVLPGFNCSVSLLFE